MATFMRAFCGHDEFLMDRFPQNAVVTIRFSYFVALTYSPWCQKQLERAYERAAAMMCKPRQEGIDLVIPVKVVYGDMTQYTVLLVQVKNVMHTTSANFNAALSKLSLEYALPILNEDKFVAEHCIAIYMNLGDLDGGASGVIERPLSSFTRKAGNRYPVGIYLNGLDVFPFLEGMPATKAALENFLTKGTDPASKYPDTDVESARHVMKMLPIMYPVADDCEINATLSENQQGKVLSALTRYAFVFCLCN